MINKMWDHEQAAINRYPVCAHCEFPIFDDAFNNERNQLVHEDCLDDDQVMNQIETTEY